MTSVQNKEVLLKQGAEAKLYLSTFYDKPCVIKERFKKSYRHPDLDQSLTVQRTKGEVRAMLRCRMNGIKTPTVYFVDMTTYRIYMEQITNSVTVKDYIVDIQSKITDHEEAMKILQPLGKKIGEILSIMHKNNIVHGDLTTSNILLQGNPDNLDLVLIDFGLSRSEMLPEDKGVDLYVLERALLSTHPNTEALFQHILDSYSSHYGKGSTDVISKLDEVRMRGRKRTMVG